MYKILEKQVLSDVTKLMVIQAPHVAQKAKAGQFIIIRIDENGERVPLTIADFDRTAGTITIIFQEVGKSTLQPHLSHCPCP
jgi:ferredoxin--NADP+ reductase